MENKNTFKKWISLFTLGVFIIIIYKALDSFAELRTFFNDLFNLLFPFVLAILIAYFLYTPCNKLEALYRKTNSKIIQKRARGLSVLTIYLFVLLLIIVIIRFAIPTLSKNITDLINNVPNYYVNSIEYLSNLPEYSLLKKVNAQELLTEGYNNINFQQFLNIENIGQYIKGLLGVASFLFNFIITIVLSIYILLERHKILEFLKKASRAFFKPETNISITKYCSKANLMLFKYIYSQVLDGIVIAILSSILMMILGIKYALLFGVMFGIFNLIPFFGSIMACVISIFVTLFTNGFNTALTFAISILVLQQIDANIINPRLVGTYLKVSPILIIASVVVGGAYFGVLGMFLAVPIVATLKTLLIDFIEIKNKKNPGN